MKCIPGPMSMSRLRLALSQRCADPGVRAQAAAERRPEFTHSSQAEWLNSTRWRLSRAARQGGAGRVLGVRVRQLPHTQPWLRRPAALRRQGLRDRQRAHAGVAGRALDRQRAQPPSPNSTSPNAGDGRRRLLLWKALKNQYWPAFYTSSTSAAVSPPARSAKCTSASRAQRELEQAIEEQLAAGAS